VVPVGLFGSDEIKVKKRKAGSFAYIEYKGPYDKIPFDEAFSRLFAWAKETRAGPGMTPFVIYASDPKTTPESELVTKVAIPIHRTGEPRGEVKVGQLPEMDVAVKRHDAPAEEYDKSYAELQKWITDNGYELYGAPIEVYTGKPKVKDGKTIIYSDIQFPVRKK
jgi:effector-binding domain-containing protein